MDDKFYLGRSIDLQTGKPGTEPIQYDPADLTTHAVVTGMTGSGKTGLCIAIMEEAALQGIPALIIDPKGDLTNLLLHFPNLSPADFEPWLDAELARRQNKPLEQLAAETATNWQQGLAEWGIPAERLRSLAEKIQFGVYTPGSDAGHRISVVSSLEAPSLPWEGNREVLREKISSTVTALLGLVGIEDIDPLGSREHILISSIFEQAWSQGGSLDLTELILQIQNPPFERLGAFPVDAFFPAKDRLALAMRVNNILAAPSFETWREGDPLNIPSLLYTPQGKPRHVVFYIAHLSDPERMFFVTLLLASVEAWMRTQPGSGTLRALLCFDEIFGYLPPQSNPPSKPPLLRMLKQARAFGVGLLLSTQNPVDLDYKGLSNAGTWLIGKLQTERDQQRLLDGLQSTTGGLDRAAYSRLIPSLGPRTFLLHNVRDDQPRTFQSRWTLNYLAGPLTRTQIPALNALAAPSEEPGQMATAAAGSMTALPGTAAAEPAVADSVAPKMGPIADSASPRVLVQTMAGESGLPGTRTRAGVAQTVDEFFLPLSFSLTQAFTAAAEAAPPDAKLAGVLYRPSLLASARVRLQDRRYELDTEQDVAVLLDPRDISEASGSRNWDQALYHGPSLQTIDKAPAPQARFEAVPAPLSDDKRLKVLRRDFEDWIYREVKAVVRVNRELKVVEPPGASQAEFRTRCAEAARAGRDAELEKLTGTYERSKRALKARLDRESQELDADRDNLESRKSEALSTQAEAVLGVFRRGRIRRFTRITEKNRLKEQARANVDESEAEITRLKDQLAALETEHQKATQEIQERWSSLVEKMEEVPISPRRSDIYIERFGVAWIPSYLVNAGESLIELPAFGGSE